MQKLLTTLFRCVFAILVFSIAFTYASETFAQGQPASTTQTDSSRIKAERDFEWREWQLRTVGKVKKVDVDVAPPRVSLAKVKDDYEGIQVANNNILKVLSGKKEIDYKVVANSTSEIKKRASRLRSYLVLLKMVNDDKEERKNLDEIEPSRIKASLLSLDSSIMKLISSPIFKEFGKVVDMDNSTRALNDLDNIIDLSERIKRSIERSQKFSR